MPSIIEVDTIKNKTGTQNTVLSTDGSGNNTISVGSIKSNTGSNTGLSIASDGQVTIAQNNPTITLGSNTTFGSGVSLANATFPAGHILQTVTNTSSTSANGNGEITAVSHSITMSSNTNKILATSIISYRVDGGGGVEKYAGTILKSSGSGVTAQTFYPSVADQNGAYGMRMQVNGTGVTPSSTRFGGHVSISYLFSPAYQGPVTITAYMEGYSSTYGIVYVNDSQPARNGGLSTITLMEVVA